MCTIFHAKVIEIYLIISATDLNDPRSLRFMADHTDDELESFEWYKKAAEAGDVSSYLIVANMLYYGYKSVKANVNAALEYYIMAARMATSQPSITQIANCINNGDSYAGLKADPARAFELFAAD